MEMGPRHSLRGLSAQMNLSEQHPPSPRQGLLHNTNLFAHGMNIGRTRGASKMAAGAGDGGKYTQGSCLDPPWLRRRG